MVSILPIFSGCTTIYVDSNESAENISKYYLGIVKVIVPKKPPSNLGISNLEVKSFGAWLVINTDSSQEAISGIGIGYKEHNRMVIPRSCQLIFLVTDDETLKLAIEKLKKSNIKGENLCVIQKST
jgi:hypothetical protein